MKFLRSVRPFIFLLSDEDEEEKLKRENLLKLYRVWCWGQTEMGVWFPPSVLKYTVKQKYIMYLQKVVTYRVMLISSFTLALLLLPVYEIQTLFLQDFLRKQAAMEKRRYRHTIIVIVITICLLLKQVYWIAPPEKMRTHGKILVNHPNQQ